MLRGSLETMSTLLRERSRARWQRAVAALMAVLAALAFSEAEKADPGPAVLGALLVVAAVGTLLLARRGISCGDDGITLRHVFRRRFISRAEIVSFGVEDIRRRGAGVRTPTPVARLQSGELVALPGADPIWFPRQGSYQVVVALESWLSARGPG